MDRPDPGAAVMRKRKPSDDRRAARYRELRALGASAKLATHASQTPVRFVAALARCGVPESAFPVLCATIPGGRPRGADTPSTLARRARYAELRSMGASAAVASDGAGCDLRFAAAKRLLRGTALRPKPAQ
jgi:hypothetical protein